MQVTIESIEQRMMLGSNQMITLVNVKLPDGSYFTSQIEPEVAERLLKIASGAGPTAPVDNGVGNHEEPEVFSEASESVEEEDQEIEWATLPDEHLSPSMKQALAEIGTPQVMKASELVALIDQVTEQMMNKAAQKAKKPAVGQIQRVQVPRPRTVPRDDYGYPIVAQQPVERDPGEVALTGSDEDGVPQL